MKITFEGTPEEIKEMLQAIGSSKEQKEISFNINDSVRKKYSQSESAEEPTRNGVIGHS
ncbi:hypothetical protein [Brochothrix thermosphacta]|uniref:hypothetical protein n=1 Tax=Brochothrix thermosphacta TaxID=2756 RepID=UPI0004BC55F9|nr:hypothetical protein [Brochothrix thermosphacta]